MIAVKNNKPFELEIKRDVVGISNLDNNITNLFIEPIYTSYNNLPVEIEESGQILDKDVIHEHISNVMGTSVNRESETFVKSLLEQTMLNYQPNKFPVNQCYVWSAACKEKLPEPSSSIIYTPASDITEPAKEIIADMDSYNKLFVGIGFLFPMNTEMIAFKTKDTFKTFQNHIKTEIQNQNLQLNTITKLNQLATMQLDLIEALKIKNDYRKDPTEFEIVLNDIIQSFVNSNTDTRLFHLSLKESLMPTVYTFINVEDHARESASTIANEYKQLKKLIDMNIKMISKKNIMSLSTITKSAKKAQKRAGAHSIGKDELAKLVTKRMKFSNKMPRLNFYLKSIQSIINKTGKVQLSHNTTKTRMPSFQKPNRRHPDNIDMPGKITKTEYKPDLHIYLDTSGSISEDNYKNAMKLCISLAKKLNINLYFNSFSHMLSEESLITVKNKGVNEIYNSFVKIPKVTGGTNYLNVWNYINSDSTRRKRVSLMITDFEYTAPDVSLKHPSNLYYMPCENLNWDRLLKEVNWFAESMIYIDPTIRKKLLL
ncbi:hypothetical protein [Filifactor alocis]|uniref:hypothetical protein n=1 Tax=Filifactor alocis TaxID=143361 RepID=UPI003F9FA5EC